MAIVKGQCLRPPNRPRNRSVKTATATTQSLTLHKGFNKPDTGLPHPPQLLIRCPDRFEIGNGTYGEVVHLRGQFQPL